MNIDRNDVVNWFLYSLQRLKIVNEDENHDTYWGFWDRVNGGHSYESEKEAAL
jgi:hypothetical protein